MMNHGQIKVQVILTWNSIIIEGKQAGQATTGLNNVAIRILSRSLAVEPIVVCTKNLIRSLIEFSRTQ